MGNRRERVSELTLKCQLKVWLSPMLLVAVRSLTGHSQILWLWLVFGGAAFFCVRRSFLLLGLFHTHTHNCHLNQDILLFWCCKLSVDRYFFWSSVLYVSLSEIRFSPSFTLLPTSYTVGLCARARAFRGIGRFPQHSLIDHIQMKCSIKW